MPGGSPASGSEGAPTGGTPGDGSPEETADETTPYTPALAMPTVAQQTQMSGKATNLVNQTMGQVQQLVSMAQQGRGLRPPPRRPPPRRPLSPGSVEGAGGALGTEGVKRAPIDVVAVDAEQGQRPSQGERVL
jgi:hypothetical protein